MTLCAVHHISTTLCGCAPVPEKKPERPDSNRDFTELAVGTRVRFAAAIREVELCGRCRLPGVRIESKHLRVTRRAWVHDAVVGPTGYIAGAQCTEYVYPPQRKKNAKGSKKNGK